MVAGNRSSEKGLPFSLIAIPGGLSLGGLCQKIGGPPNKKRRQPQTRRAVISKSGTAYFQCLKTPQNRLRGKSPPPPNLFSSEEQPARGKSKILYFFSLTSRVPQGRHTPISRFQTEEVVGAGGKSMFVREEAQVITV